MIVIVVLFILGLQLLHLRRERHDSRSASSRWPASASARALSFVIGILVKNLLGVDIDRQRKLCSLRKFRGERFGAAPFFVFPSPECLFPLFPLFRSQGKGGKSAKHVSGHAYLSSRGLNGNMESAGGNRGKPEPSPEKGS
jgi:hypothetical protein